MGGFGAWATFTTLAGAVVAPGQVEVDHDRQVVQHPDGGVVAEILVHDGDRVEAGQVLLRLDGGLLRSELAIVEGQLHETLARRGRLEAERADQPDIRFAPDLLAAARREPDVAEQVNGQNRLFEARRETLRKSLDQIDRRLSQTAAQIDGIAAQTDALTTQRRLIARELADQKSLLDRGLTQSGRVLALEREAAGLAGQIGALAAERAQAAGKIAELELERLRTGSQRREDAETELRDIGYRELELIERRRALVDQIGRLDLRAPAAGVVYAMTVSTPQAVIRAADPVLYVVPSDRPLVVAARVSPLNVDRLRSILASPSSCGSRPLPAERPRMPREPSPASPPTPLPTKPRRPAISRSMWPPTPMCWRNWGAA